MLQKNVVAQKLSLQCEFSPGLKLVFLRGNKYRYKGLGPPRARNVPTEAWGQMCPVFV